jgi:hypothetical protein
VEHEYFSNLVEVIMNPDETVSIDSEVLKRIGDVVTEAAEWDDKDIMFLIDELAGLIGK